MRSRVRSTRENRRFSCLEKVLEDFFHGQREPPDVRLRPVLLDSGPAGPGMSLPRIEVNSIRSAGLRLSRSCLRTALQAAFANYAVSRGIGQPLPRIARCGSGSRGRLASGALVALLTGHAGRPRPRPLQASAACRSGGIDPRISSKSARVP
jgi:hypothetical protein